MTSLPKINEKKEAKRVVSFLKATFKKQKIDKAIIGISGGVDSAVSLSLLTAALKPKNIIALYMPSHPSLFSFTDKNLNRIKKLVKKVHLPKKNFFIIPINRPVDRMIDTITTAGMNLWQKVAFGARECFTCPNISLNTKIRLGNLMARLRMILLYDFAKKYNGLVVGTENRSEKLLGYFTRFGDNASDIEPISHLYKTQVYELARFLKVPKEIINQKPSAGLWENQTDEDEFGFTYKQADQVLSLYFDKKMSTDKIRHLGYKDSLKIIRFVKKNSFKRETPYLLKQT